jgi:SNF2 family DNA or RNA helicase
VAIAFKRLFPRVRTEATVLHLSDTDDVRADLEWFMLRYPLAHEHSELIAEGAKRIADRLAERDRILMPTWAPGEVPGFNPGFQPYLYQAQAAQIAINHGSLLLGDDVGLGKTISAAAALTMGAPLPAAIVVQPHLADQWAMRLREFTNLRVHVIKGTQPYTLPDADAYIFRYSNVAGWVDVLRHGTMRSVIFDEIQELRKGTGTAKGGASDLLSRMAEMRMGLTATPIYNYGGEIHTVMGFLKPDVLGDYHEFSREWGWDRIKDPDALGAYLRETGYFLRRTEDDPSVDAAMPPPNVLDWEVAYDDRDAADHEAVNRTLALAVLKGNFVEAGQAARELDLRMRQVTGVAKARSVAAYVRLLLEESPRVLLAGWHREVYDIWQDELSEFDPVLYTGSETSAGKGRSVEAFMHGNSRVMMISLRSGAGLDGLQYGCRDVVFGELDWSPQVHHQVAGRLRRPGQTEQVNVHYLHTTEGSDPVLLEVLGIKSDQARGINDPGLAPTQKFSDSSRIQRLAKHVLGMEGISEAAA